MDQTDVALIVNDTIMNFPKDIDSPFVMFVDKKRFSHLLDLMKLEKHIEYTPCFVAKTKGGSVIYYCLEIINSLTQDLSKEDKKLFIEGITLHELLHIWNGVKAHTIGEAVFAEKLVHTELKNLFPDHYRLLKQYQE
jgi:hypothetical protein